MELNGALSNRRAALEIHDLRQLCSQIRTERSVVAPPPAPDLRRRPIPTTAFAEQVLRANGGTMRVAEIFLRCQEVAGGEMSYQSLRTSLSHGSRMGGPFERLGYGRYRLRDGRHT
jgi:hypothetical protein